MTRKDFEETIFEMIEGEEAAARHITRTIGRTRNVVVRILMRIVLTDTAKHAHMLRTILNLKKTPKIESEEVSEVIEVLKRHVEEERVMMKNSEDLVDEVEDRRVKFLLENIVMDEKRHHSIMKRIIELVSDSKTSDDKWWDFLYRYSRLTP
jgi:hypothetical protein